MNIFNEFYAEGDGEMRCLLQEPESVLAMLRTLERLETILVAELSGQPFDPGEAVRLTEGLTDLCPDIAYTVQRVTRRMENHLGVHGPVANTFGPQYELTV